MSTTKKQPNRYIILIVLCICESMYLLPYLRWTFYDTMLEAFNFTNTQIASLGGIFGIIGILGYIVGGPICDRFSPKKILILAYALTGIGGFWHATYPGYAACVVIYIMWGIATSILLWDCMIRLTRTLASAEEQGRFFGLLEGGRGAVDTIAGFAMVAGFAALGSSIFSLTVILYILAAINVIGIILVIVYIPDEVLTGEDGDKMKLSDLAEVVKMPAVWLIALVILCNYTIYTGGTYMTSYLTDIVGISVTLSAVISVCRNYVLMMCGGPVGGFLGDKFSISKTIVGCFVLVTVAAAAFVFIPAGSGIGVVFVAMLALYLGLFFMRGIYFGTVEEVKIPMKITGTAVGFISLIGFSAEVYMNYITGFLLDNYEGATGYHYLFIVLLVFAVAGLVFSVLLNNIIKKQK